MPLRPAVISTEISHAESKQGGSSKQIRINWMDGSSSTFDTAWLIAHDYSEKSLAHRALRSAGRVDPSAPSPLQGATLCAAHIGELPEDQEELVDWSALHSLFPLPDGQANLDGIRCSPVPEAGRTGQLAQHDLLEPEHSVNMDAADAPAAAVPAADVPTAHHDAVMQTVEGLHSMLRDLNQ